MIPVLIAGGSGTRLWPVSRSQYPKQYCQFFGQSLIERSAKRLDSLGKVRLLTVEANRVLAEAFIPSEPGADSSSSQGKSPSARGNIYEPYGCNTAPAIALLCRTLQMEGESESIVAVFPADHLIEDQKEFVKALHLAEACAEKGPIVTLGIAPHFPATGYGYIETKAEVFQAQEDHQAYYVKGFREKPPLEVAQSYLEAGNYHWNAGIFVFKVSTMINALEKHQPKLWEAFLDLEADGSNIKSIYDRVEPISIDYAVMEKEANQVCIPIDVGWSDIGSWDEVARLDRSPLENVYQEESTNNYVWPQADKVYGLVNVDNLVVVDTKDALLIAQKEHTQNIRRLLDQMIVDKRKEVAEHTFDVRPWGQYESLRSSGAFHLKVIHVEPHCQLSYQSHEKRSEHWVITQGAGEVVVDDEVIPVKPGSMVRIPQGAKHRMRNTSATVLEFVEVQLGSYFGEDDIVRYEDDYNRV